MCEMKKLIRDYTVVIKNFLSGTSVYNSQNTTAKLSQKVIHHPVSFSHCIKNILNHSSGKCPTFSDNGCSELHNQLTFVCEENPKFYFQVSQRKNSGTTKSSDYGDQFASPSIYRTYWLSSTCGHPLKQSPPKILPRSNSKLA